MNEQELLKQLSNSLCVRFGTDAAYWIGQVAAERVGYAQLPSVVVNVICRPEDVEVLVPIIRQRVYGELAERGWSGPDDVGFVPSIGQDSRRKKKFSDANESSPTFGRDKMGLVHRFRFDMRSKRLAAVAFAGFGSFAPLPDNPERQR